MKNWTTLAAPAIAACLLWAPAIAGSATTWRCGSTYSDRPCEGGKALALDDAREATLKRDADRTTREAQAAGDRMERERLRLEKAQANRPTLIDSRPAAPKPQSVTDGTGKKKKGKKEPDYFSAHDPVATAKKKAEKAAARRGGDKG
ncbi:hypothetical protein [Variovorax sp. JS1663]|uniref:hypothetical protein n=1 Tax=Variovorax sp. JS1663 TaxID=1851577 RepID=UPI000B349F9C|nr:hypothetical protein [Variovorax sp. JS1663]OUM01801.1 hypothetical protein A8M77_14685 [Variovorax sp. JS1663]